MRFYSPRPGRDVSWHGHHGHDLTLWGRRATLRWLRMEWGPGVIMIQKYKMYIGGEWTDSVSGETFESIDPYTGEVWGHCAVELPTAPHELEIGACAGGG
jgi:hypothetical protein